MANYTQAQCDAMKQLSWETTKDGRFMVKGMNSEDQAVEFEDTISEAGDSETTKRDNAHTIMKDSQEYKSAPADSSTPPIDINI